MFSTDTCSDIRTNLVALLYSHLYQLANTFLVKNLEWINLQNLLVKIYRKERSNVVT